MLGGKLAVVCGFGDVGKGAAEALRGQGARVVVTEIDPICALQATMQEGYSVVRLEDVVGPRHRRHRDRRGRRGDGRGHRAVKHNAILGNVGHFDTEIDMAGLRADPRHREERGQAAGPRVDVPGRPLGDRAVQGRLVDLGNATGHPSFVMSNSFANQVLAQIELYTKPGRYPNEVHRLPKHLTRRWRGCTWTPSGRV